MHPLKMPYSVDIFTTNLGQCNQSNSHNLSEDRHISSYILSYCATTSLHSYNVLSQLLGLFIGNTPAVAITDFSLAKELFNRQLLQFNILDLVSLLHQYLIWFQQEFRHLQSPSPHSRHPSSSSSYFLSSPPPPLPWQQIMMHYHHWWPFLSYCSGRNGVEDITVLSPGDFIAQGPKFFFLWIICFLLSTLTSFSQLLVGFYHKPEQ